MQTLTLADIISRWITATGRAQKLCETVIIKMMAATGVQVGYQLFAEGP